MERYRISSSQTNFEQHFFLFKKTADVFHICINIKLFFKCYPHSKSQSILRIIMYYFNIPFKKNFFFFFKHCLLQFIAAGRICKLQQEYATYFLPVLFYIFLSCHRLSIWQLTNISFISVLTQKSANVTTLLRISFSTMYFKKSTCKSSYRLSQHVVSNLCSRKKYCLFLQLGFFSDFKVRLFQDNALACHYFILLPDSFSNFFECLNNFCFNHWWLSPCTCFIFSIFANSFEREVKSQCNFQSVCDLFQLMTYTLR